MLERLRDAGLRLGIVTGKKRVHCLQTLDELGYRAFFPVIVAEEDAAHIKPAPDPLLLAARLLGAAPAEIAYVGDNPDDIIAARAAGMTAVAVAWSLRTRESLLAQHPDALIEHPDKLLALLDLPRVP